MDMPMELHALTINYDRKRIDELPNVYLSTRSKNGKNTEYVVLGDTYRIYLASGKTGKQYLAMVREREETIAELKVLESLWQSKYRFDVPQELQPRAIRRMAVDRATFDAMAERRCTKEFTSYFKFNGEEYRSKSECSIASVYTSFGMPFKYETRYGNYFPDFTVYAKVIGRYFYHEHYGMMDSDTYRESYIKKQSYYSDNGLIAGLDVLSTFESTFLSFDERVAAQKINSLILQNLGYL